MSRPKHTRRDANHATTLSDCRAYGMVVWDTADIGGKVLDALVCWRGHCLPVEIKPVGKCDHLTDGEHEGIDELARVGVYAVVATRLEDILRAFKALQ